MLINRAEIERQNCQPLDAAAQPRSGRELQQIVNDQSRAALVCGPITPRLSLLHRLLGLDRFTLEPGVELLIVAGDAVRASLRDGRYHACLWAGGAAAGLYAVPTGERSVTLQISRDALLLDSAGDGEAQITVRASYAIRPEHALALIRPGRAVSRLCELLAERLQPAADADGEREARALIAAATRALRHESAIAALGLRLGGLSLEHWRRLGPPRRPAHQVLAEQVRLIEQAGLVARVRRDPSGHIVTILLISHEDQSQLMIYCACGPTYPLRPPQILYRYRGQEHGLDAAPPHGWGASDALLAIVHTVTTYVEGQG